MLKEERCVIVSEVLQENVEEDSACCGTHIFRQTNNGGKVMMMRRVGNVLDDWELRIGDAGMRPVDRCI